MNFIGELAALATSVIWAGTSVLFTKSTQQVGSIIVNRIRVILALFFLMLLNWAFNGYLLPFNAGADRWLWFALSGAIGYVSYIKRWFGFYKLNHHKNVSYLTNRTIKRSFA